MSQVIDLGHPARTRVPVDELIRERHSPKQFDVRMPSRDILLALFEAARWAPSSFNEQPWSFLLATLEAPQEHARLASCLLEANREWAQKAPVLLLCVASENFARNDRENKHSWHDVGLAVGQLTLQATAFGLVLHQMAGFDSAAAVKSCQIPEGQAPVSMVALGYPMQTAGRPLPERQRKPLEQMLFGAKWGTSHSLLE